MEPNDSIDESGEGSPASVRRANAAADASDPLLTRAEETGDWGAVRDEVGRLIAAATPDDLAFVYRVLRPRA